MKANSYTLNRNRAVMNPVLLGLELRAHQKQVQQFIQTEKLSKASKEVNYRETILICSLVQNIGFQESKRTIKIVIGRGAVRYL